MSIFNSTFILLFLLNSCANEWRYIDSINIKLNTNSFNPIFYFPENKKRRIYKLVLYGVSVDLGWELKWFKEYNEIPYLNKVIFNQTPDKRYLVISEGKIKKIEPYVIYSIYIEADQYIIEKCFMIVYSGNNDYKIITVDYSKIPKEFSGKGSKMRNKYLIEYYKKKYQPKE